jgi:two-component system, NarL family, sensor kinase
MDISQEVTLIVIGSFFFLLVAIGIIILVLVYQKKQLRFIYEKRQLKNQFQEELLKSRLEAQEETLTNLSREIHDNIGQLVSSAKMLVGVASRKLPDVGDTLHQADQSLSQAMNELRAISKSLSTEWLEQFNFYENLQNEAGRVSTSGEITIHVSHEGAIALSKERQLILFRMVQESIQNAIKHSRASNIYIKANPKEDNLVISIEDNGDGFDVNDSNKQGIGMNNIKHRAALIGGEVQWRSDNKGTKVSIIIPQS